MIETPDNGELNALNSVLSALSPLSAEARKRILQTVATFLDIDSPLKAREHDATFTSAIRTTGKPPVNFSEDLAVSPKEFLLQKQPRTDVERIACLAFYLTHYRDTPFFKTLELSKLNTEAAQPKFANAAKATANALQYGYLAAASKGLRQISAAGEQFIRALPDRDAAKTAMSTGRPRKRPKRKKTLNGARRANG